MSDVEPRLRTVEKDMAAIGSKVNAVVDSQATLVSKFDQFLDAQGAAGRTDWKLIASFLGLMITITGMGAVLINNNTSYQVNPLKEHLIEYKEENEKQWKYISNHRRDVIDIKERQAYERGLREAGKYKRP